LGRFFYHVDILPDQEAVLDQLIDHIREVQPDALIVAGDIFDRANPRREAVDLFDRFLGRIYRETSSAIVVIAGNHDAPERIGYGGALHDPHRVLIRGPLARSARPLILEVDGTPVAVSALPYAGVFASRAHYQSDQMATNQEVIDAQLREAKDALSAELRERGIPGAVPWVVVAHTFVAGGHGSESERPLSAGGVDQVSPELFSEAAYTALGHLHRRQALRGGRIAYSGSIMQYGFDEAEAPKSASRVEIEVGAGPAAAPRSTPLPLTPPRPLCVVEGTFEEVMARHDRMSSAFVKFQLTDRLPVPDAMARLRERYPNAVALEWTAREHTASGASAEQVRSAAQDPLTFVAGFIEAVTGEAFTEPMRAVVRSELTERGDDDE